MPEMPEVETVRQTLRKLVLNKEIKDISVFYDRIIQDKDKEQFKSNLIGKRIVEIGRKGKYLIFELSDNIFLVSHLRMEGKYFIKNNDEEIVKHEHIIFHFTDNTTLRYHDTRKFGTMELKSKDDLYNSEPLNKIGMDADMIDVAYLKEKSRNKHQELKVFLLDQTNIAGIGNIYADEICHLANLHPKQDIYYLSDIDLDNIVINTKNVMKRAIEAGGTTIRSYTSSLGVTGLFQLTLEVHTRENEACKKCGNQIIKIRVGGRGTYLCPNCQKIKK